MKIFRLFICLSLFCISFPFTTYASYTVMQECGPLKGFSQYSDEDSFSEDFTGSIFLLYDNESSSFDLSIMNPDSENFISFKDQNINVQEFNSNKNSTSILISHNFSGSTGLYSFDHEQNKVFWLRKNATVIGTGYGVFSAICK